MKDLNIFQKAGMALGGAGATLMVLATAAGAQESSSVMPDGGANAIASTVTDTMGDAWPIVLAVVGVSILLGIVFRVARR